MALGLQCRKNYWVLMVGRVTGGGSGKIFIDL
jgi:hypothetical protein